MTATLETAAPSVQPVNEPAIKRTFYELATLAEWIKSDPPEPGLNLDVKELDQIADYAGPMECAEGPKERLLNFELGGHSVYGFMPGLEWWRETAFEFLVSTMEQGDAPEIKDYREKLLRLYSDVLNAYVWAMVDDVHGNFTCPKYRGGFMAVRAYRVFTREVCAVAQILYPGVDLAPLLERA